MWMCFWKLLFNFFADLAEHWSADVCTHCLDPLKFSYMHIYISALLYLYSSFLVSYLCDIILDAYLLNLLLSCHFFG